jgi:hypothetical protein
MDTKKFNHVDADPDVMNTYYLNDSDQGYESHHQQLHGLNEFIIVTVFPCGFEDLSHLKGDADPMDRPYMLKI